MVSRIVYLPSPNFSQYTIGESFRVGCFVSSFDIIIPTASRQNWPTPGDIHKYPWDCDVYYFFWSFNYTVSSLGRQVYVRPTCWQCCVGYTILPVDLHGLPSGRVIHSTLGELTDETNQAVIIPIYGVVWPLGSIIG